MYYTDNPVADYDRYSTDLAQELERLPKCCECEEPIQTDECYEINGELICPSCLEGNHKKWTDDYMD